MHLNKLVALQGGRGHEPEERKTGIAQEVEKEVDYQGKRKIGTKQHCIILSTEKKQRSNSQQKMEWAVDSNGTGERKFGLPPQLQAANSHVTCVGWVVFIRSLRIHKNRTFS